MNTKNQLLLKLLLLAGWIVLPKASAQVTNVIFSEDFSGSLNTNKWIVGTRTLEGGTGTIVPVVSQWGGRDHRYHDRTMVGGGIASGGHQLPD